MSPVISAIRENTIPSFQLFGQSIHERDAGEWERALAANTSLTSLLMQMNEDSERITPSQRWV